MIDEQPRCGNPACGNELIILAGHRRRQYCSDTCKMAAHRARLAAENQARYEALQLELAQREREELRQRWGDLPPEAFDLLRRLRMIYGITLAEQVAGVLTLVRDEARKSLAEERAMLIDEIMLVGEQLDFPLIVIETFDLSPDVFAWSAFCGNADIEKLLVNSVNVRRFLRYHVGNRRETWESTGKILEKPLPIWGVSMECWKYIARASFGGKNILLTPAQVTKP